MPSQEDYLDKLLNVISQNDLEELDLDEQNLSNTDHVGSEEETSSMNEDLKALQEEAGITGEDPDLGLSEEPLESAIESLDFADADLGLSEEPSESAMKDLDFADADMGLSEDLSESAAEGNLSVSETDAGLSEESQGKPEETLSPSLDDDLKALQEELGITGGDSDMGLSEDPMESAMKDLDFADADMGLSEELSESAAEGDLSVSEPDAGLSEESQGKPEETLSSSLDDDLKALQEELGILGEDPDSGSAEGEAETPTDADIESLQAELGLSEDRSEDLSDLTAKESETDISEISSMTEEDIDRLLAQGRETQEESQDDAAAEFHGDIAELLADSDDSDLQEIHDLLEKSDNNEAVGEEIESLIESEKEEAQLLPEDLPDPDENPDAQKEQLSPKEQKALEKKRLKEEAAAAKKAKAAEKKAEKEARKAAKKAEKEARKRDKAGTAEEGSISEQGTAKPDEPIDTTLLDSILSEAGKISGDDKVTGFTGNYNAEVDGDLQEQLGDDADLPGLKEESENVQEGDDFGIDLGSLLNGSDGEDAGIAEGGENSDFPDFVALDADDIAGIAELTDEGEEEDKPKKKGFFSRFLEFLTQEDEEEEEENENIQLSDENQEIIEELDQEKDKKQKKGKKGKKKDKKDNKKDKAEKKGETPDGDEEESEEEKDKKEGKKKKDKKPKKEKAPKETEPVDPKKRLTFKKILPIALVCLSLAGAIIILTNLFTDYTDKAAARTAYHNGDYQTCYQNLYGKDLNDSDQVMLGKSESILTVRLWIREYEILEAEGSSLEALDSLIQSVYHYPDLYEKASQCNATQEVANEYAVILNLLSEKYGLTEDQAKAIAAEPDDIQYTKQVNTIVQGGAYGSWNEPEPEPEKEPMTDVLPEESELPDENFIDTNTAR